MSILEIRIGIILGIVTFCLIYIFWLCFLLYCSLYIHYCSYMRSIGYYKFVIFCFILCRTHWIRIQIQLSMHLWPMHQLVNCHVYVFLQTFSFLCFIYVAIFILLINTGASATGTYCSNNFVNLTILGVDSQWPIIKQANVEHHRC